MENSKIISLYKKYLAKQCTDEEAHLLQQYMQQKEYAQLFRELILEDLHNDEEIELDDPAKMAIQETDAYFEREYFQQNRTTNNKRFFLKISVAAAVLIVCGLSFFLYKNSGDGYSGSATLDSRSTLITDAGVEIKLDGKSNVELLRQNGIAILQDSLGDIHVKVLDSLTHLEPTPIYQTIRTAKGKQFHIYLSDGSTVFLNSASELKFPLAYADNQREVELQGEGFFEIEADKNKPFIVKTHDQRIKVYGTKFNVSNYENEQITKTALFHGKVSVQNLIGSSPQKEYILQPGEQIVLDKKSKTLIQNKTKNEVQVLGWKNGVFVYDNATLSEIMKDFSRWYNIDVDFQSLPALTFSGTIPRKYTLDKALDVIARTANIRINRTGTKLKFDQ